MWQMKAAQKTRNQKVSTNSASRICKDTTIQLNVLPIFRKWVHLPVSWAFQIKTKGPTTRLTHNNRHS